MAKVIITNTEQVLEFNSKKHNTLNINSFVLPYFNLNLVHGKWRKSALGRRLASAPEVTTDDFLTMKSMYDILGVFHFAAYALIIEEFKNSDTNNIQDYLFDQIDLKLLKSHHDVPEQETVVQRTVRTQIARFLDAIKINNNRVAETTLAHTAAIDGMIDFMNYDNGKYTPCDYALLYYLQGIVKKSNTTADTITFKIEPYKIDLLHFLNNNKDDAITFHSDFDNVQTNLRNSVASYVIDGNLTDLKFDVKKFKEATTLTEMLDSIVKTEEEKTVKMIQATVNEQQSKYDQLKPYDFKKDFQTMAPSSFFLKKRFFAAQAMMKSINDGEGYSSHSSNSMLYQIMGSFSKKYDEEKAVYMVGQSSEIQIAIETLFENLYGNYSEPDKNNLIKFISSKHYKSGRFGNHIIELNKGFMPDVDYKYLAKQDYLSKYSGLYYTVNTFNNYGNKTRTVNNIGGVNAFYLDLDVVKNLKPEYKKQFMVRNMGNDRNSAFVYHLTQNLLDLISQATKFPTPTMVLLTGHGLQLVWAFRKPIIVKTDGFRKQLMNLLKKMGEYVRDQMIISVERNVTGVRELKKVFGDRTEDIVKVLDTSVYDMARLLRMPLSYNDKGEEDYHQDFAFPFASAQPSYTFNSLLDLIDYLDIKNYSQQFVKGKTTRKKKATLTHNQKLEMIEKNHTTFEKPIEAEEKLIKVEEDKPQLDLKLLLSHTAIKGFEPIKKLTQSHLSKNDAKQLATATHRMNFTCTRTINEGQFVLLGKIDPANVKLNVLGQTIHVAKQFASDMKGLYKYALMNNKKIPSIFGTIDDNSSKSVVVNADSVQKVFGQTYYAQTNLVRLINALPSVINYWNATQTHYRNNTLLLVSNMAVGMDQYRLVLPNVDKLTTLINDGIDKHFDEIVTMLKNTQNENVERQNAWEQFIRQINVKVFSNITVLDSESNEPVSSLAEDELQNILNSYNYVERSTMALSRATFARKLGLVQGQTDEWFVARGLSAFLNPYTNTYRNPLNKFNFNSKNVIGIDGVKFDKTLTQEIKNAQLEGYYEGLTETQIQQKIIYQLMVPFLYAQPQNDLYARQIEKLVKKEQEKQYAISIFMSNEVLNYKLHDEMNTTEFAEKVHHMSRGSYYRNLKLIGGKEAVKEAYEQLQKFVSQLDDEDIHNDELANFKQQQLVGATDHANNTNVENILTVNRGNLLVDDNVAVIAELMHNIDFKHFVQHHNWSINITTTTINNYMNDYISHIYLGTKLNNTSLQQQHNMWLADHYDLFHYLYELKQANKDGIEYLINKDLNNPKIKNDMKEKIKDIAKNMKQRQGELEAMKNVKELVG